MPDRHNSRKVICLADDARATRCNATTKTPAPGRSSYMTHREAQIGAGRILLRQAKQRALRRARTQRAAVLQRVVDGAEPDLNATEHRHDQTSPIGRDWIAILSGYDCPASAGTIADKKQKGAGPGFTWITPESLMKLRPSIAICANKQGQQCEERRRQGERRCREVPELKHAKEHAATKNPQPGETTQSRGTVRAE
jgi:hypothetical protein